MEFVIGLGYDIDGECERSILGDCCCRMRLGSEVLVCWWFCMDDGDDGWMLLFEVLGYWNILLVLFCCIIRFDGWDFLIFEWCFWLIDMSEGYEDDGDDGDDE